MGRPVLVSFCFTLALLGAAGARAQGATEEAVLTEQRAEFKLAWAAAEKGDIRTLAPYLDSLKDYPLYPYLRYAYLDATLDTEPDGMVEQFLDENADLPLADALRDDWLVALTKREEWSKVLAYSRDDGATPALRCAAVSAHFLKQDEPDRNQWKAAAQRLWLTPSTPAEVCKPLFDYLESQGLVTGDMRRRRVELALQAKDSATVLALLPSLPSEDRAWALAWTAMAADPAHVLEDIQVPAEPQYLDMLIAGVRQVARTQPLKAAHLWTELSRRYRFPHDDARDMRTLLALQQAWHLLPEARATLKHLHESYDPEIPEWRARLALRAQDWPDLLHAVQALGANADSPEWRYWRARAYEALGRKSDARWLYSMLAKTPDYYGFLAADRLGEPYRIVQHASEPKEDVIQGLAARPGFVRARELVYQGLYPQAEAEWNLATRELSAASRCQAALLAERWGWHGRAIPVLASGGCWQDLSLIYPLAFTDTLQPATERLNLDLSWVYGLIRTESVFRPNAISPVGAQGLMQLMPATGRDVAGRLGLPVDKKGLLLDPDTNLAVGSMYLHEVLQHFEGSETLATAAYDAGTVKVEDWLPESGLLPMDVWVDTIPYTETRNYVHRVMGHTVMFDWRINGKPQRLSSRLGAAVDGGGESSATAEVTVSPVGR
ncbi:MAG: transglycosylase SLT domain-containing protein [Bacillota bacterium]